jgi:metal-sulfur cluster biosynthetic enzyme
MSEMTTEKRIDDLMTALRDVIDPELGMNVIELGLIRDVQIEDGSADITMILTTPFCPYAPAMIKQVKATAEASLGMTANVEMGTEMWDPSMMEEGAGADWGLF